MPTTLDLDTTHPQPTTTPTGGNPCGTCHRTLGTTPGGATWCDHCDRHCSGCDDCNSRTETIDQLETQLADLDP